MEEKMLRAITITHSEEFLEYSKYHPFLAQTAMSICSYFQYVFVLGLEPRVVAEEYAFDRLASKSWMKYLCAAHDEQKTLADRLSYTDAIRIELDFCKIGLRTIVVVSVFAADVPSSVGAIVHFECVLFHGSNTVSANFGSSTHLKISKNLRS